MHPVVEWLAAALVLIAAFVLLVGAVGLIRLPDFYMRLHAPTKASTLGVGGVLLASMLVAAAQGRAGEEFGGGHRALHEQFDSGSA